MSDIKTSFNKEEVEAMLAASRERMETLEALECARIVMEKTGQYPRFIQRINFIIQSIQGAQEPVQEVKQEDKNEDDLFEDDKKTNKSKK